MLSVRLPKDLEYELEKLAQYKHTTKSEIVKDAVAQYLKSEPIPESSFEAGKHFFGKYSSGRHDSSTTYKDQLKEKYHEKHSG